MTTKKISQSEMREMMAKLKSERAETGGGQADRKRKYKLSSREVALLEMEKKRKVEEKLVEKRTIAKNAGVPENFFDSAKTKAFLNLNKAPQKSILKNSGGVQVGQAVNSPAANSKAKGSEWTSSAPILNEAATAAKKAEAQAAPRKTKVKSPSPQKTLLRTPSGGTINHLAEEEDGAAPASSEEQPGDSHLPEGFFDDPVVDARARGKEYKNPEDIEWEAFKKEIAVEVSASVELAAEEQLTETTGRQLEEIDEQMRAWSRVRDIEIRKDAVDSQLNSKKATPAPAPAPVHQSDEELDEADLDEFLDWRQKKT